MEFIRVRVTNSRLFQYKNKSNMYIIFYKSLYSTASTVVGFAFIPHLNLKWKENNSKLKPHVDKNYGDIQNHNHYNPSESIITRERTFLYPLK